MRYRASMNRLFPKGKKRFPHQPHLVMGQLNHSFLPPLYPQTRIMTNVQMKIFRIANTAAC